MSDVVTVNGKSLTFKVSPYRARNSVGTYRNKIFDAFAKIGVESKYVTVSFGGAGGFRSPAWAKVEWIVNGETFSYRCDSQPSDVDNLASIAQVIDNDSKAIRRGLKSFGMVMNQFRIGFDPDAPKSRTPREVLGVPEGVSDVEFVKFRFKQLSKHFHPDAGGNIEDFKEILDAKNTLLKELGGDSSE